jgi:ribosome-binding factor A
MPSYRSQRMAEAIREVVSSAILFKVADPRVRAVTVLGVEVSGDLGQATVLVSIMGSPSEQSLSMKGLQHASGFLQSLVAERLQSRITPVLRFKRNEGAKKSVELSRLIDETLAADRRRSRTPDQPSTNADSDSDAEAADPPDAGRA